MLYCEKGGKIVEIKSEYYEKDHHCTLFQPNGSLNIRTRRKQKRN